MYMTNIYHTFSKSTATIVVNYSFSYTKYETMKAYPRSVSYTHLDVYKRQGRKRDLDYVHRLADETETED